MCLGHAGHAGLEGGDGVLGAVVKVALRGRVDDALDRGVEGEGRERDFGRGKVILFSVLLVICCLITGKIERGKGKREIKLNQYGTYSHNL